MRFGSVCSGIEAASVAWNQLGWKAAFFSEIEAFPCAVLANHYPDTPNLGDMTKFKDWPDATIDLLCGGTPCQSFSVAGLRKGLDDPRGNLMLTFGAIAAKYRPRWLVWENVPGVLSSNGGRDFGSFLGLLGVLGYGFAYRVLDAQYFGLAQRRKRVFVVGCLGDWRRAAAVLFERESLRGNPAPSREARKDIAPTIAARTRGGGGLGTDFDCDGGLIPERGRALTTSNQRIDAETETFIVAHTLKAKANSDHRADSETYVTHALTGEGFDASEDGTGRGTPLVPTQPYTLAIRGRGDTHALEYRQDGTANALLTPNGGRGGIGVGAIAFDTTQITSATNRSNPQAGDPCHPVAAGEHAPAIAFGWQNSAAQGASASASEHHSPTLDKSKTPGIQIGSAVRRLTPKERERLQGFPDDYTAIPLRNAAGKLNGKWAKDGPRYKALGNSWAVPVARWIGRRIEMVDAIKATTEAAA